MKRIAYCGLLALFTMSNSIAKTTELPENQLTSKAFFDFKKQIKNAEDYRKYVPVKQGINLFFKNLPVALISLPYVEQYVGCCVRDEMDLILEIIPSPNDTAQKVSNFIDKNGCEVSLYESGFEKEEILLGLNPKKKYFKISCPMK